MVSLEFRCVPGYLISTYIHYVYLISGYVIDTTREWDIGGVIIDILLYV